MKCPNGCEILVERSSQGIEVDVCPGCRGIWLDAGEFDPLVAERFAGEPLEAFFALTAEDATGNALPCPRDRTAMSMVRFDDMELDWCSKCHGIWVDGLERASLAKVGATKTPRAENGIPDEATQPGDKHVQTEGRAGPSGQPFDLDARPSWSDGSEQIRAPGIVEVAPEGPLESGLELDLSVTRTEVSESVVCASCGVSTERNRCMLRMDAYWCEGCVVNGDFPGSHGPPVSRRMAEAALAMSKAQTRLTEKKTSLAEMKKSQETLRLGMNRHNDMHVHAAVQATARAVWNLFRRDG